MTRIEDRQLERLRAMPVGRIDERFELLEEAGTGGMGTVYRARDHASGGLVALKVLAPTEAACVDRFERERQILAELSHPGIVGYVASGMTPDDEPYLAMEWLDGESLAARLARGPLPWREAAELGRRIADALDAAHARGVVHRDLKPSNLFLVGGSVERVVVLDFGVARLKAPDRALTETGTIVGTPGYMAPEQARGRKDVDERADLFALGCVLYRAIAGEAPFSGDDVLSILAKLALEDPPRLAERSTIPPALDALVLRLLAKEKEARPASAREVADALDRILAGDVELAPTQRTRGRDVHGAVARESLPTPVALAPRRRRWPWLAAVPLALGAISALAVWISEDDVETRPEPSAREAPSPNLLPSCRAWARVLTEAQRPDGSFGMERHREPMAWTTGQISFALARAHQRCGVPGRAPLAHGAEALVRYGAVRWGEDAAHSSTPAIAWAALASSSLAAALDDPALRQQAVEARDLLLPGQRADGGFRYSLGEEGEDRSNAYSTVMALWALAELERDAPSPTARDARLRASAWVRSALADDLGDPPLRSTAGLAEQAVHALLLSRALGDRDDADSALFTSVAAAMASRCELEEGRCGRALSENGETYLEREPGRGPNLLTFWHPWMTLAARRLAGASDLDLPAATRHSLEAMARWGETQMIEGAAAITTAPAYQLSEYVLVASEL